MFVESEEQAMQLGLTTEGVHPQGNNVGLAQAYNLRNLSAAQAMDIGKFPTNDLRDKIARAQAICALVKAWAEAADRIRIIRGKPLPGSLRPIAKPKKAAKHSLPPPSESATEAPTS